MTKLQKMLCDKWDFIYMQAQEQVKYGQVKLNVLMSLLSWIIIIGYSLLKYVS